MYIKYLELIYFKSYLKEKLYFPNVTLFAGLNGSGKSTVFQSLRMFWNYMTSNEILINELGDTQNLRNRNSKDPYFEINVTLETGQEIKIKISTIEKTGFPDIIKKNVDEYIFSYISAERLGPREHLPLRNTLQTKYDVGQFGEYTLDILDKYKDDAVPVDILDDSVEKNSFIKFVERWMKEISPNISIQAIQARQMNAASLEVNGYSSLNVGFGISYALPIIVQLTYAAMLSTQGKKCIILLENPEAHLHPKGQTKIAEFIALIANFGVQILVETHSDYILDGLRLAVKSNIIENKKVGIYFCELDQDKNTKIQNPHIGCDGLVDSWPEDFFDTAIKNRIELM